MARMYSNLNSHIHAFSCNHCFAQIVICGECGEMFRRIHWNNRGCKSIVWENHFTVELKSGLNIDIEG